MKIALFAVCLIIGLSEAGRRPPRPNRARQLDARRQSNRLSVAAAAAAQEDHLPYWESRTLPRDAGLSKVLIEARQFYPGQGGPPGASPQGPAVVISGGNAGNFASSEDYSAIDNEIPRPINSPQSQDNYYPRPPRPTPAPVAPSSPRPRPNGCLSDRGQFASARSCAHYLNCWDGEAVEQKCPHGLFFNEYMNYCDYEYNVKCGVRPSPGPKPGLTYSGARRCPEPNGRYRSATNCSEFFVCLSGSPIRFGCPEGLVYNDEINVCDFIEKVDCKGAATPIPLPSATESIDFESFNQISSQPEQPSHLPSGVLPPKPIVVDQSYFGQSIQGNFPVQGYPGVGVIQGGLQGGIHGGIQGGGFGGASGVSSVQAVAGAYPGFGASGQISYPSQGSFVSQGSFLQQGLVSGQVTGPSVSIQPGRPLPPSRPLHVRPPPQSKPPPAPSRPPITQAPFQQISSLPPQSVISSDSSNPNPPYPLDNPEPIAPSPYSNQLLARTKTDEAQEVNKTEERKDEKPEPVEDKDQFDRQDIENRTEKDENVEVSTILVQNPWEISYKIPEDLIDKQCKDGDFQRLDEVCTSVVVCKNERYQLLTCQTGYTYDKPSDTCKSFTVAKC